MEHEGTTEFVDQLRPDFLADGYPLGAVRARLEDSVAEAARLGREPPHPGGDFNALLTPFTTWRRQTEALLDAAFTSRVHLLSFVTARQRNRSPLDGIEAYEDLLAHSGALVEVYRELQARRDLILSAAHELRRAASERTEILEVLRDQQSMSEELWLQMHKETTLKPFLQRLRELGLTPAAVLGLVR